MKSKTNYWHQLASIKPSNFSFNVVILNAIKIQKITIRKMIVMLLIASFFINNKAQSQCTGVNNYVTFTHCGNTTNGCYMTCDRVVYSGNLYESNYNYNGNPPLTSGGWWTYLGVCCTNRTVGTAS